MFWVLWEWVTFVDWLSDRSSCINQADLIDKIDQCQDAVIDGGINFQESLERRRQATWKQSSTPSKRKQKTDHSCLHSGMTT